MKYNPSTEVIPQDRRADINAKILTIIDSGQLPEGITKEDIFNGYTGVGGLHKLNRADYENYFEFSEDKKEIEQGQFLTHTNIADAIVKDLKIGNQDLVCDLSCGTGVFFNSFNENQCYGCEIDHKAIRVAKFLYPEAHIECVDIRYYKPEVRFDFVVGNPPFNLKWKLKDAEFEYKHGTYGYKKVEKEPEVNVLSQHYFFLKAAELMKPGGICIAIVPDSYLKDEFFTKCMIGEIEEKFSFLFQYSLSATAFKNMGVTNFNTKVICFQRLAENIKTVPYSSAYIQPDQALSILSVVQEVRYKIRTKLHREFVLSIKGDFGDKVKKYLYEIKQHRILQPHLTKALTKVNEFRNQIRPDTMKWEDWEKSRLTENKVLGYLKRIIQLQTRKEVDTYRLVQNNYGYHYKAYSRKATLRMNKLEPVLRWNYNELIISGATTIPDVTHGMIRSLEKRRRIFNNQTTSFKETTRNEKIDRFLDKFAFYNNKMQKCKFNEIQKQDLGLIFQKRYAILNWEMGGGKTCAAAAWAKFNPEHGTFIVGPSLAIEMTWEKFMILHNKKYIKVTSLKDVQKIDNSTFVLISTGYVIKYKKQLKSWIKKQGYKINFIFDESDEITSPSAKRTQAILDVFRRAKRKLLTTGTTTRNNITELYSQLELLYNNSVNMTCHCDTIYKEVIIPAKDCLYKELAGSQLKEFDNPYYKLPFPAKAGSLYFKRCFNPSRTTVFGIEKHNQDLYNEAHLRKLLEYTIITRKFKEIAGDKYVIKNISVKQNVYEEEVYRVIVEELQSVLNVYFNSTGNARKDAALKMLRQMTLLIDATSMPNMFHEYKSKEPPSKAIEIFNQVENHKEKIAIGCTSIKATEYYVWQLKQRFPFREVFEIKGEVTFKGRERIRKAFEATSDGILVATQQSLKSSVNIPTCSKVILESKQWNIPKIKQFFFRFIRYNSPNNTEVIFISYENTIEVNLMALLMNKERLNDYIKTLEYKENSDIYGEYDIDLDILNSLITKTTDSEGKVQVRWGSAKLVL
jgi:hypothetical protein